MEEAYKPQLAPGSFGIRVAVDPSMLLASSWSSRRAGGTVGHAVADRSPEIPKSSWSPVAPGGMTQGPSFLFLGRKTNRRLLWAASLRVATFYGLPGNVVRRV